MLPMLRQEKPFATLLAGNLLSKIGDGVHEFVFIITVLKVTGNELTSAGLIYFFRFIPYLLLGPLGGALADRLSRRQIMFWSDAARMAVTAGFCVLLMTGQATPAWVALIGMAMTALRTLFQPAFQSAIPDLVRGEHLPQANGATQVAGEIGGMVGPALGAAALAFVPSAGHVLLLDALTYAISALCVLVVRLPRPAAADGAKLALKSLYGDFMANLAEVGRKRDLFVTIVYSSACILLVGGALRILIPALMKHHGHADSMVGYALSLIAAGTILGSLLSAHVTRDFSTRQLMRYWGVYGVVLAMLPLFGSLLAATLAGCLVLGFAGAFVDVALPTNIQQLSSQHNMGKNFSLFSTLANTGEALSGSFAGALVLISSVAVSLSLIGLLIASVAFVGCKKAVTQHG